MSYIENELSGKRRIGKIEEFLEGEGFKYGSGARGEGYMYFVAKGDFVVWFALCEDYLSLYAEYDCGGCLGEEEFHFNKDDFDDFLNEYKYAIAWAKDYI